MASATVTVAPPLRPHSSRPTRATIRRGLSLRPCAGPRPTQPAAPAPTSRPAVRTSGSIPARRLVNTTYRIDCRGAGGAAQRFGDAERLGRLAAPTAQLSADPGTISAGQSFDLALVLDQRNQLRRHQLLDRRAHLRQHLRLADRQHHLPHRLLAAPAASANDLATVNIPGRSLPTARLSADPGTIRRGRILDLELVLDRRNQLRRDLELLDRRAHLRQRVRSRRRPRPPPTGSIAAAPAARPMPPPRSPSSSRRRRHRPCRFSVDPSGGDVTSIKNGTPDKVTLHGPRPTPKSALAPHPTSRPAGAPPAARRSSPAAQDFLSPSPTRSPAEAPAGEVSASITFVRVEEEPPELFGSSAAAPWGLAAELATVTVTTLFRLRNLPPRRSPTATDRATAGRAGGTVAMSGWSAQSHPQERGDLASATAPTDQGNLSVAP